MNMTEICKLAIGRCLKVEIKRVNSRTFHLIPRSELKDAWFSQSVQIKSIIDCYDIDLVLDVGANKGQFAAMMRQFYAGPIISFEPVATVFEALHEFASADDRWTVFNCALGSESKAAMINKSENALFSSLLTTNKYCVDAFGEKSASSSVEQITVRRLDEMRDEMPFDLAKKRIFLKMDTQGYDLEVFKGTGHIVENVIALQSEVSQKPIYEGMPHWMESLTEYEKAGFSLVALYPVTRDGFQSVECDCLMVRGRPPA